MIIQYEMYRRVTIMLDENLEKKLRKIQAKLIKNSKKSISFSQVVNDILRIGLWNLGGQIKICDDCRRMKCSKGCTCECHFPH